MKAIEQPAISTAGPDAAATDGLSDAITALLPALDEFLRFHGPDPAGRRSAWYPLLDEPLPRTGAGPDAVLETLRDVVIPNGLRIGHPGFSGWVTTAPSTTATAAHLAQAVASPQRWWTQPGNLLDVVALRWLIELLGFPPTFGGTFTAGGSSANLLGIGAARQAVGERLGLRPSLEGIEALHEPRVYASSETHHVVGRALGVLGMGRANLRSIATDATGRIDLDLLQAAIDADVAAGRTPVAIVGCAGDVNMGLVDPLPELSRIAHERGIWFHVDGAYGGFGLLDERVRPLYGDLAEYDSFAIDPHKWLAAPVGTGAIIVRDTAVLGRAFTIEVGDYDAGRDRVSEADLRSPFDELGLGTPDFGVDFSAPARGMAVWAILKEIGADGMRARVTRHLDCARRVADRARASDDLELLREPVLSICTFRYHPAGWTDEESLDRLNERVLIETRARGRVTTSSTRVDGRLALRPCFINPRSGLEDADALVDEVLTVGRPLAAQGD
jgi:aromatic-L-amino-acid/L-tryptophan decarboxylase